MSNEFKIEQLNLEAFALPKIRDERLIIDDRIFRGERLDFGPLISVSGDSEIDPIVRIQRMTSFLLKALENKSHVLISLTGDLNCTTFQTGEENRLTGIVDSEINSRVEEILTQMKSMFFPKDQE